MMKGLSRARQRRTDGVPIAMKRDGRNRRKALSQLHQEYTLNSEIGMTQFAVEIPKPDMSHREQISFPGDID